MFFSLNLIESYGSGIRRAKDALSENGSPSLKFYPDNDTDDYTNAVIDINTEFMVRAKSHVSEEMGKTTKETTKETNRLVGQILTLMKHNPEISAKQISEEITNITADGVRYHIKKLKAKGVIKREGSTKSGQWIVSENE